MGGWNRVRGMKTFVRILAGKILGASRVTGPGGVSRTRPMEGVIGLGRLGLAIGLALAGPCAPAAQEGEAAGGELRAVLASYRQALGGVATAELTGFVEIGVQERGAEESVRLVYARAPRSLRIEVLTGELRIVQGTDGAAVWAYAQRTGGERMMLPLPPEAERGLRRAALSACHDPLLKPARLGYELTLRDESPKAEGQHLIEVSEGGRPVAYVRIDRETGRVLARWNADGAGEVQVNRDYREVDGHLWPSEVIAVKEGVEVGRWRLADLRLDELPDPGLFAPPPDLPPSGTNSKL